MSTTTTAPAEHAAVTAEDRERAYRIWDAIWRRGEAEQPTDTIAHALADAAEQARVEEREACAQMVEAAQITAALCGPGETMSRRDGLGLIDDLRTLQAAAIRARTSEAPADEETRTE